MEKTKQGREMESELGAGGPMLEGVIWGVLCEEVINGQRPKWSEGVPSRQREQKEP